MKICIVGGGTAGWIAAYFLSNDHPGKHEITVVESSQIGIIGAGEGSTGTMVELLNGTYFNTSVDIDDFLEKTNGTRKQGIYHHNWTGDGTGYFAPIDSSPTWYRFQDHFFKYALASYGKEKMHLCSPIGIDYELGRCNHNSALHFDGHKVGEFFRNICVANGVKLIDAVVDDCSVDKKGNIDTIYLDDRTSITADFFIDCTGFSKILASKVGIKWNSYNKYLPVNSAIPFQQKYTHSEKPNTFTTAHALSSGWMWGIPLQDRKGCGYVYDDRFLTQDQAIEELETTLGYEIEPIKHIKFEAGRSNQFWKKNVLVLGLSAAFVEPLEATSIHSTIIQLLIFSKEFLFDTFENTDLASNKKQYNEKVSMLYDTTLDFISFHYQGGREDSKFWQWIKNDKIATPKAAHFLDKSRLKIPGFLEINGMIGSPNIALWNWISAGMNIISPEQAKLELQAVDLAELESQFRDFVRQQNSNRNSKKSYIQYT